MAGQPVEPCQQGILRYEEKNYKEALEAFNRCIDNDPNNSYAYYNRGNTHLASGSKKQAVKDFQQAVKLNPENPLPYYALAKFYLEENDTKRALSWINKGVERNPDNPLLINMRGLVHFTMGNYAQAFKDFTQAITLDSTYASAYNNRGSARFKTQDIAAPHRKDLLHARDDYLKALRFDPEMYAVYRNLGYISLLLEEPEVAIFYLKQAQSRYPDDPVIYFYQAQAQLMLKDTALAVSSLRKAIGLYPAMRQARLLLSKLLIDAGSIGEAKSHLGYLLKNPGKDNGEIHYLLAVCAALSDDVQEMENHLVLAEKSGYFKEKDHRQQLQDKAAFKPYANQPSFKALMQKIND